MSDSSPPVVLAIGEACIDVVRRDGSDTAHPGGSPLNVAVGVSRLGVSAALATRFSSDDRGEMLAAHAGDSGVTLTAGSQRSAKTSVATATIDADGAAHYDFDFAWDWTDDIDFEPRVVHTGSIGAVMTPGGANVLDTIRRLRPHSLVTFDPNSRPALMGDRADAARIVDEYVRLADIVKASDEDLEWLCPHRTPLETALVWSKSGPALVVLTAGANGATVVTSDNDVTEFPAPAVTVSDTIGAGDSFMAGLLASLSRRGMLDVSHRGALHALTPATIAAIIADSLACAAITVQREGADPPRLDEVSFGV